MSALRLAAVAAGVSALLLAGCAGHAPRRGGAPATGAGAASRDARPADTSRPQSERYRQNDDNGPAAPPIDVSKIPEPVPKSEPRSRYGNKASYDVLGKTYRVLPDSHGYVERGIASWYGNKFHGYMTSSFEPYDMYAFTAAHKTLPLPSYARVTNLDSGKSVVVRVNDRGPFHDDRIIDLSYAAAVKIGVWPKGTARVEVRAIDPKHRDEAPPLRIASAPPPSQPVASLPVPATQPVPHDAPAVSAPAEVRASGGGRVYLQLGSFGERGNAERALENAKRAGIDRVGIVSVAVAGHTVHRVRVGPFADADAADAMTRRIERLGLGSPRLAIEQ